MATLQLEHDRIKQALDGTTLSNRKMEEENAQLKAERASRDAELRSTKTERDKLNSQLMDIQYEKLNIQRDLEELTKKSEQTERQLLKAKEDIQNLTETLIKKPKLLDGQWRLEPRFDREYHQRVQGEIEYHWPLKHMGVAEDTLQHVNILFIGPVGGKSSFINTVDSSLRGHVTATASAGNRDQSFTSAVRKYPIYASDNRRQLKIQLCDCRGLEDGVDITQDIKSILEGHILNNYVINTASPLKENMHAYNKHPGLEDKIHCVVYVLDAEKHSDHADIHTPFTTEDVRSQIENIQAHVDQKGIPQLILLNKVDIVCESTMQTTSDVYRSSLIRQRCIDAAEFLGLPPMTVLPMRNYYMETSTTDDIGILALYNIRQMLREADTFLRVNHLEELRTAK
ncbi:interferon-induced protein 44-like [Argopecten irradians]|uniref:interferon-induced protein 44-like n=1 Tax=Argopecten irradians TaxID=31199 RepID=UPI00371CFBD1